MVRSKFDQLDQTSRPRAEREIGKLSVRQTKKATKMNPNLLVILPHNKTDCFLYVLKSRPGPSFVPTIFSIRPFVDSVLLFSKSC